MLSALSHCIHHSTISQFQGKYYYDECLPMGCSSSCRIFEEFSDAIKWILTNHNVENSVKVLDDFFFIHKQSGACQADLQTFLDLYSRMGIPVAPHKTFGPSQVLEFQGVQLDTINMQAALLSQKIHDYSKSVIETLAKNKITLRELKSLIDKLQFCTNHCGPTWNCIPLPVAWLDCWDKQTISFRSFV